MHSGDRKELESKSVAQFERLFQQMRSNKESPESKQALKDFLSQQSPDAIANIIKRRHRKTVLKASGLSILIKLYEPSEEKQFSDILNKIPEHRVPEVMAATISGSLGDRDEPTVAYKRWISALNKFGYCAIQPFICKAVQPLKMFGKATSHKESFNSFCLGHINIFSDRAGLEKLVEVVEPNELLKKNKHVQDLLCDVNMALYQKLIDRLGHFGFGKILASIVNRLRPRESDKNDRSPFTGRVGGLITLLEKQLQKKAIDAKQLHSIQTSLNDHYRMVDDTKDFLLRDPICCMETLERYAPSMAELAKAKNQLNYTELEKCLHVLRYILSEISNEKIKCRNISVIDANIFKFRVYAILGQIDYAKFVGQRYADPDLARYAIDTWSGRVARYDIDYLKKQRDPLIRKKVMDDIKSIGTIMLGYAKENKFSSAPKKLEIQANLNFHTLAKLGDQESIELLRSMSHSYLNKDSEAKVSSVLQKYFPEKYKTIESTGIKFFADSKGDSKGDSKADSKQERKYSAESSLSLDDDESGINELAWTLQDEVAFLKMQNILLSEWIISDMKALDSIFNEVKPSNQNLLALQKQLERLDMTEKEDVVAFIGQLPELLQRYQIEEPTKTNIQSIISNMSSTFSVIKLNEAGIEEYEANIAKQSGLSSRP